MNQHFGQSQSHSRQGLDLATQEGHFQRGESAVKICPVQYRHLVQFRAQILAPETARECHRLSIWFDKPVRDSMETADHESVVVDSAKPLIVCRAHNLRSPSLSKETLPLFDPVFGLSYEFLLAMVRIRFYTFPYIRPLQVGVMLKVTVAAVVRAHFTGKADLLGDEVVGLFHLRVKL